MKKSKIVVLLLSLAFLIGGGNNNLKLDQNVGETNKNNNIVQKLANYSSEVYYTLSFPINKSNNSYATNYDVTVNDKKWSVPGNQALGNYVKVGGKSISNAVRRIYSIDALSANIGKIVIDHGNSEVTCNKLEIKVYASMNDCIKENNPVLTKEGEYVAEKESVIELDQISGYESLFYSIDYTLSSSSTKNKGLIINSIRFYEFKKDISEIAKNDIKAKTTKAQLKYSFDVTQGESVFSFVKVTSKPSDWSGEYLIVYENGENSVLFNSSLKTIDAKENNLSVEIKSGTIEKDKYLGYAFTIKQQGDLCSIKSASGQYISGTSGSNTLNTSTSEDFNNEISCNNDGTVNIISNTSHLRYNSAIDNLRFRYFKSDTYTKQNAICLYRLETITETNYTFFNMKMNLGAVIEAAKVQALVDAGLSISSYGVAVAQKEKLGESITISDAVIDNSSYVGIVSIVSKTFESVDAMQKTDANGTKTSGDYVIFNADLSFPDKSKYNVEVSAVAFFKLGDGTYVFFQERTLSVASLAKEYIANTGVYDTFDSNVKGSLKALAATSASVA